MTLRPNMRPEATTEESPRERAARRTAELRGHDNGLGDDGTDEYYIELGIIPDGWSYEWKTRTILGAEDPAHQVALARKGWEVVPASRHPELMPMGYTGVEITRKGMVLMERPLEITNEARSTELRKARMQMRDKEAQLSQPSRNGEFERTNKGDPLVKISKKYEAIPIPE
jgi:hypothetical protein